MFRSFPHAARLAMAGWLIATAAACAPARPRPTYADPNILFQDDFSQTTSGWDVHTNSLVTTTYDSGQYLIGLEEPGKDIWGLPGLDLTDLAVEVDATYAAGPDNNEYGLMCRYATSGDKHSFYFFVVSTDGYYAMGKVVKNKRAILNPANGDFQTARALHADRRAANRLSATCQGRQMSFAVNGTPVGSFTDGDLTHGDIGLMLGTFDEGGAKILFDNLVVRKP